MYMNAIGIDVSKRKSMVAILRPGGEVVAKPFEVSHLSRDLQSLIHRIKSLEGESRIVTGISLVKKADQIVFHSSFVLHVEAKLAVHGL